MLEILVHKKRIQIKSSTTLNVFFSNVQSFCTGTFKGNHFLEKHTQNQLSAISEQDKIVPKKAEQWKQKSYNALYEYKLHPLSPANSKTFGRNCVCNFSDGSNPQVVSSVMHRVSRFLWTSRDVFVNKWTRSTHEAILFKSAQLITPLQRTCGLFYNVVMCKNAMRENVHVLPATVQRSYCSWEDTCYYSTGGKD